MLLGPAYQIGVVHTSVPYVARTLLKVKCHVQESTDCLRLMQAGARVACPSKAILCIAASNLPIAGFLLLMLSACGGGGSGGGGSGSGNDDGSLPPSFFETSEYRGNFGLARVGASSAYAEEATGDNVKVAVIDSGVDLDHPEFTGAIASDSINIVSGISNVDDPHGHGTAVSGVIGARRNEKFTHGVAFDSTLLVIRSEEPGTCAPNGCAFRQSDVAEATDYAVAHEADIINYSVGETANLSAELEQALGRAVDAGVVLVFSAGNAGQGEPGTLARFARGDAADGLSLVVGAVDSDEEIAAFSNRAGNSQDVFLVAPGVEIVAPAMDAGTGLFTGTSFAAAHVSGAAALMIEAAPFLRPEEVVALLLDTATDLGEAGMDMEYGRGLVNMAVALGPQGELTVPLGDEVGGRVAPLESSGLVMGAAFGSGPDLNSAIFLDDYGRPYWFELGERVRSARRRFKLLNWLKPSAPVHTMSMPLSADSSMRWSFSEDKSAALADLGRNNIQGFSMAADLGGSSTLTFSHRWSIGHAFGLAANAPHLRSELLNGAPLQSPYLAFTHGGDGIAIDREFAPGLTLRLGLARNDPTETSELDRDERRAIIAEIARVWPSGQALNLHVGSLAEKTGILDTSGGGALTLEGASTGFVGVGGKVPAGDRLAFFGQINYGITTPDDGTGLIRNFSRLHSTAFASGVKLEEVFADYDTVVLAITQPLRVEVGSAIIDLPLARTFNGKILRQKKDVDVVPDGREIDLELVYNLPLAQGVGLSLNWLTQLQPGHEAKASPVHAIGFKWHARF